jgi:hypothetical protein
LCFIDKLISIAILSNCPQQPGGFALEEIGNDRTVEKRTEPSCARDPVKIAAAVGRHKAMRGVGGKTSQKELKVMKHEGHRF